MAILQSCCCWRSVRTGSYASGIYTAVYFTVTMLIMAHFVHEEHLYWRGNHSKPQSSSILEPESISPTTMTFNVVLLCCATCGVITSILLIVGIYKDQRTLLVPWILTIVITLVLDMSHSVYVFALKTTEFNPMTAILFTMDFFLLCLNVYSLLCVISQYQEYKAGRGTAENGVFIRKRVPQVKYAPRATATSCLSTRRPATYHETTTQSPTAPHSTLLLPDSSDAGGRCSTAGAAQFQQLEVLPPVYHRPSIKHVQFPDDDDDEKNIPPATASTVDEEVAPSSPSEAEGCSSMDAENGAVVLVLGDTWNSKTPALRSPGVDTAPLIESTASRFREKV